MDVQIDGRHTSVTPDWRADIEGRVADLHPGNDMTHIRVTLTKHDHRKAEDSYDVVIVAHIPGHTITARKLQSSFEEAIRDAFSALKVELDWEPIWFDPLFLSASGSEFLGSLTAPVAEPLCSLRPVFGLVLPPRFVDMELSSPCCVPVPVDWVGS